MAYHRTNYPKIESKVSKNGIVIFIDLDGTLMKFPFKRMVLPLVLQELSERTKTSSEKIRSIMIEEEIMRERTLSDKRYNWDDIVKEVAKKLGTNWSLDLGKLTGELTLSNGYLFPRAKQTLRTLKKMGYILCAATNGFFKYQNPIIEKLDLKKYFDYILTPDTTHYYKNEIGYFRPFISKGRQSVMVGDEYVYDVYYPKRFGLKAILLRNSQNYKWNTEAVAPADSDEVKPDAVINDISELPAALELIV
jgi:putative hydrolase of the HAD superfamily